VKHRRFGILGTALIALSACTTTMPPIDVTRFSRAGDVVRGPVAAIPDSAPTLEQRRHESVVGQQLTRLGFAARDATTARYVYAVDVTRDSHAAAPQRAPVTIGIGGGAGGYGGGIGVGASFGLGRQSRDRIVTRLAVRLVDKASGQVVWEGRAEGLSDPRAQDSDVGRLAAALFRDFPGESGRTISVP
jgi:Domain of unknown function (DUF4136)